MGKNTYLRLPALLLCLALLLSGCGGEKEMEKSAPAATEAPAFVEEKDLHLYLEETIFIQGEPAQFEITVLAGEALTGDIVVKNEVGKTIAAIQNDGSGVLHATARVDTSEIGNGALTAAVGSVTSRSILYSVQPEVTETMMENLLDAAGDVAEAAYAADSEDIYSEAALAAVQKHLENDSRIRQVCRENDGLYYLTQDSLLGFYGPDEAEGMAGASPDFHDPADTFEDWLNEEDVSARFLESEIPFTNDRALFLTPESSCDDTMQTHTAITGEMFNKAWTAQGNPNATPVNDEAALDIIMNADYNDYGFVMLGAHGRYITCSDGSDRVFIRMASGSRSEVGELILKYDDLRQNYWLEDLDFRETARTAMGSKRKKGQLFPTYSMQVSGLMIEESLGNKIFDNTVLYLFVCYSCRDQSLYQAFFDHGVSLIVGCTEAMSSAYSIMVMRELADTIRTTARGEKCMAIPEVIAATDKESIKGVLRDCFEVSDEEIEANGAEVAERIGRYEKGYNEAIAEKRYITYRTRSDKMSGRLLAGYTDAEGNVFQELEDGTKNGVSGAEVTLYRWLNHNFEEYEEARALTDANGDYKFEDVPCGLYGVLAEKDGFRAWTACEIGEDDVKIEPIRLLVELSGRVLDEYTDLPLEGALVTLKANDEKHPVSQIAETDAEGKWSMIVSPAAYTILFDQYGYVQKKSIVQQKWLEQGPYRFDVRLQPVRGLVVSTLPEEEYGEFRTQLILRPQVLSSAVEDARITAPFEGVFAQARSIDMGESLRSYAIAVPDHIYANENVVSLQMYSHFFNEGAHGIQGTESIMLDAASGEELKIRDLLDKDAPDAEARLRSWLKEALSDLEPAIFTTMDELVDSIVKGNCGTWCLTREGLQLSLDPAEAAMWVAGGSYPMLLYSQLSGIVDKKYLPGGIIGDGTATVEKLLQGDERITTHTVWGNGKYSLVVDGLVSNFEVRWLSDTQIVRGVAFYAELLDDAVVLLPDVSHPLFEVRWESGGKSFTTRFDFN